MRFSVAGTSNRIATFSSYTGNNARITKRDTKSGVVTCACIASKADMLRRLLLGKERRKDWMCHGGGDVGLYGRRVRNGQARTDLVSDV